LEGDKKKKKRKREEGRRRRRFFLLDVRGCEPLSMLTLPHFSGEYQRILEFTLKTE
jgi:hypothetical protein